ncbi:PSD1 and planctomycete cytochrome C domain-containing protein [Thalassoroseus pseudoceratinae]|uniref:PSD1 and planctomycete cytochrome C domain-containing protein n=1 Tax=Thalassoroseus pseudoceratinae TaxID=2713176 RepID=UPI00197F137D|nr:PSD1 and planctomycete cytochrome C domain-containing protein [Thalassoroseus pseudoceratinae]
MNQFSWLAFLMSIVTFPTWAFAQPANSEGVKFFESKIRPIFLKHCYGCHSTQAGKAKGGLKVDTSESLFRGGDSGSALVPRKPDDSLLYQVLLYRDDVSQMPPSGKLPASTVHDIRRWIEMGAPDPRVIKPSPAVTSQIDIDAGRNHWAYQSPVHREPNANEGDVWAQTEVDRYIIAELDRQQLTPVADADAATLVRRLSFVLTGLPMTPDESRTWTDAIERTESFLQRQEVLLALIDELLASPQYGERWGRHWLDVARYAESTGGDQNNLYQHAWRYRDYVIDAFNNDKPFDEFVREQIAGDLLPIADDAEWAEQVIATGFLTNGVKLVGEEDQQQFFADLVDEQIDATTRAFLATTVACARCHDHKFDPIPQADYYALAGIFRSTETHYGLLKAQARQATTLLDLTGMGPPPGTPDLDAGEYAALVAERDQAANAVEEAMRKIRGGENVFRGTLRRLRSQRDETEAALQAYSNRGKPRVFAMGVQDRDQPLMTRLLLRGELDKPAQIVPRGLLQVLTPSGRHRFPSNISGSGRIELANWIASDKNPLTARVMANRIWHWMFGRGLVRTTDDFGVAGDRPTHPELLDYLALRLIENGWSVKSLVREIALSRTFQLSSSYNEKNFATDPDNRFLWRMNKHRLEGEAIRDAMLFASGKLEMSRPLGTYLREVGEGNVGQNVFEPVLRAIDADTRSVYLPRVRSVLPEMLELFDAPDSSFVTGTRQTTSSLLQALYLLNNEFVQTQADALAGKLNELPKDQRIQEAYLLLFGREPTAREVKIGETFLSSSPRGDSGRFTENSRRRGRFGRGRTESVIEQTPASSTPLSAYCQALMSTAEFRTLD